MGLTKENWIQAVTEHDRVMFPGSPGHRGTGRRCRGRGGEAVLPAWQKRGRLRDPGGAGPWLVQITANCARRPRKKSGRILCCEDLEQGCGGQLD